MTTTGGPPRPGVDIVDVRGPRFSATVTTLVLAAAVLTRSVPLLAVQVAVFGVAALAGLRWSPYGNLFRLVKRLVPRVGPPPATEPAAGPRFSQLLGFLFTGAGLTAVLAGQAAVGWALVLAVLALSTLLAVTGLCVGCELYVLGQRARAALGGIRGRDGRIVELSDGRQLSAAVLERLGVPPGRTALLEFVAPGCRTCAAAHEVLREVASGRDGVVVALVDAAEHADLARIHGVLRAPTTLVVDPAGRVQHRVHGVPDAERLRAVVGS